MKLNSFKLVVLGLGFSLAGAASAATSNSAATVFSGLTPLNGFNASSPVAGLDLLNAASNPLLGTTFNAGANTRAIAGGTLLDQVFTAGSGSTFNFSSNVVAFFGTWNFNPLNEDGNSGTNFSNRLVFNLFSSTDTLIDSFSLARNFPNNTVDFGYTGAAFDYFTITSDGSAIQVGGNATETYSLSSFQYANAVAAVPEPETYAMMLAGLGALGFMARRRRIG